MTSWAQRAADALDGLGDSPTADEARAVTDDFESTDVMAALAARGGLSSAALTLTNAQILALPTTAREIVAAPGEGKLHVCVSAVMVLDATNGAYSDFDLFSLFVNYGTTWKQASIAYDEFSNGAFADNSAVHLLGMFTGAGAGGTPAASWFADHAEAVNKPLTVFATNGSAGDLDGGGTGNTLAVYLNYLTITL